MMIAKVRLLVGCLLTAATVGAVSVYFFQDSILAQGARTDIEAVDDAPPADRERMIVTLLSPSDDRVVELLIRAFEDPNPYVRYAAAWALNPNVRHETAWVMNTLEIPAPSVAHVVDALLHGLQDDDVWVRTQLIVTLRGVSEFTHEQKKMTLDERIKDAMLGLVKDADPYIRDEATRALRLWEEDPRVKEAIGAAIHDEMWLVRRASLWAGNRDFEVFETASRDEDPAIRNDVVIGMWDYDHDPDTRHVLLERLSDPVMKIVADASRRLGFRQDQRAVEPVLYLLAEGVMAEHLARMTIEEITGRSLEDVKKEYRSGRTPPIALQAPINRPTRDEIRRIIQQLDGGNQAERVSAALRLAWVEEPEALEALLQAIGDPDPRVRFAVIDAIRPYPVITSLSKIEQRLDRLMGAANDPHRHVRRLAVEKITTFKSEEETKSRVMDFLKRFLHDADPFVREIANKDSQSH